MLTYNRNLKPKRKDRPWILMVLVITWVLGTAFFHSAWEPYESSVLAVVKGILFNHSWLVPYVSGMPYLQIQPFYFWLYSAILKIFNINDIESIANGVRLINTLIILSVIGVASRIGSNLSAYKNGRTVVLLLISCIGFINNSYQITPNILVLLGFCVFLYALQLHRKLPGISGWILFIGLMLISISFTCEFILIAVLILAILPIIDKHWCNKYYFTTLAIGCTLFLIIFCLYCYQLQQVDNEFFLQWQQRYVHINISNINYNLWEPLIKTIYFLGWYTVPSWFLVIWTLYKRRVAIFKDKIIQVNIILMFFLIIFTVFSGNDVESAIFPIILPIIFIASLEVDSIRISIVSLLNWFSIFVFGTVGLAIWAIYFAFDLNWPPKLIEYLLSITQDFHYERSFWQLLLAVVITVIWIFMITRRHIRGREVITNWASGTTYIVVLFMALCLPWFDSVLTFRLLVDDSLKYIDKKSCIITNEADAAQNAFWYYYADINVIPSFTNLNYSLCNQAIVASEDINNIDQSKWQILWRAKRPIDKKVYYLLKRKN